MKYFGKNSPENKTEFSIRALLSNLFDEKALIIEFIDPNTRTELLQSEHSLCLFFEESIILRQKKQYLARCEKEKIPFIQKTIDNYYSCFISPKFAKNDGISPAYAKAFESNQDKTIMHIEDKVCQFLSRNDLYYDRHRLDVFLGECSKAIDMELFSNSPQIANFAKDFLRNNKSHKVLARILLTLAIIKTRKAESGKKKLAEKVWASQNIISEKLFTRSIDEFKAYEEDPQKIFLYAKHYYDGPGDLDYRKKSPKELEKLSEFYRTLSDLDIAKDVLRNAISKSRTNDSIHFLLGTIYLQEKGDKSLSLAIEQFEKCYNNPDALYLIALHIHITNESNRSDARNALIQSSELGNLDATIRLIRCYLYGDARFGLLRDLEKADTYAQNAINNYNDVSRKQKSELLFLLGEIANAKGNYEVAKEHYAESAKLGNSQAERQLTLTARKRKTRTTNLLNICESDNPKNICFINNTDHSSLSFLRGLIDEPWNVYTSNLCNQVQGIRQTNSYTDIVSNVLTQYENSGADLSIPEKIVLAFMSNDSASNLNHALACIDELYNIVLDLYDEKKKQIADTLIDIIDIYIRANFEEATPLIDANLSNMIDNIYFKVHVIDINKKTADELLFKAPLFLPCLEGTDSQVHLMVIGNTDFVYEYLRQTISCAYMEKHKLDITVLCPDSSKIENKLYQACPGLRSNKISNKILPRFINVDLNDLNLPMDLYMKYPEINYFVIDIGNDLENILFGQKLRGWLLKYDPTFTRRPFIAVRTKNEESAYWARKITIGKENIDSINQTTRWSNKLDVFCFGITEDILKADKEIEQIAFNIHLSYCSGSKALPEKTYYSNGYNRLSSRATAVGLLYRLFDDGIHFDVSNHYHSATIEELQNLANRFEIPEENTDRMNSLVSLEQTRFNMFAIATGWDIPTLAQVHSYIERQGPISHKMDLAKLNPYIFDYNNYNEEIYLDIASRLGKVPNESPVDTTKRSIRDTAKFFSIEKSKKRRKSQNHSER